MAFLKQKNEYETCNVDTTTGAGFYVPLSWFSSK